MSISRPAFVVLRNGLSAPLDALRLLWELEQRGLSVRANADGLTVGPRGQLTDDDREAIRQFRDELRILVCYCEGAQ